MSILYIINEIWLYLTNIPSDFKVEFIPQKATHCESFPNQTFYPSISPSVSSSSLSSTSWYLILPSLTRFSARPSRTLHVRTPSRALSFHVLPPGTGSVCTTAAAIGCFASATGSGVAYLYTGGGGAAGLGAGGGVGAATGGGGRCGMGW